MDKTFLVIANIIVLAVSGKAQDPYRKYSHTLFIWVKGAFDMKGKNCFSLRKDPMLL